MASQVPSKDALKVNRRKRQRAETRFQAFGIAALCFAALALFTLLGSIISKAIPGFYQTKVELTLTYEEGKSARTTAIEALYGMFPEVTKRKDKRNLKKLIKHILIRCCAF